MKDTGEIAHIKYCPFCGKERTRPKPEPVKTLAEKFKVFGLTKRWEDSDDVYNTLAEIAREHHKQEKHHD